MKDRKSRALSIRTIFSRPGNQTSIVSQKRIDAGGDIIGIQRQDYSRGYDEGRVDGLKRAWSLVHDAEGRPGKRQLAELLRDEIRKTETGAETRVKGTEERNDG